MDAHEETDDALTSRFRVWQRKRGHRYSLDDVLTAREALRAAPTALRVLDLGCGLGSVTLMTLHGLPSVKMVAVEAQAVSADLARRNFARNEVDVELHERDFRELDAPGSLGERFDLVTGTPPYAPVGTATPSPDSQRAHARIEYRGGVEAYVHVAATHLRDDGVIVVCGDARRPERALGAAVDAGLSLVRQVDAVPREGRDPLFSVFAFHFAGRGDEREPEHETFVARDRDGERTAAYIELRAFFGLHP